mmetsp:Transcript_8602/g.24263  ORF Transcript_8602/g.24263 Transcript_8602/m.24263 type:complete len:100 (-) Transcript_8602:59-358(-)|eukprot:CAMPEP_0119129832 /NCGR_PEP_ID=MMETSP1310-20130426/7414_1 /TAXON_ID=464262 /ORGANISM="Genus nov. species nov., Strain RCC2339" /LENGTH=99 /DNA_ID=CAMNT_0007120287 /DNA_START=112 /DNA_END=411 /DNA_ORIENTATION=+
MADETQFKKAVHYIRNGKPLRETTNQEKLDVYALFKQATVGDVQGSQPWAVQLEARAKWDAWNAKKGTSKEDAMKQYVEYVAKGNPDWEKDACLENFSG